MGLNNNKTFIDSGFVSGRLTVINESDPKIRNNGYKRRFYLCHCECGKSVNVAMDKLKSGETKSCGCLQKEVTANRSIKHGHAKRKNRTNAYSTWIKMRERCLNESCKSFPDYGGRGIKICDKWLSSFENFLLDMGEPGEGLSIERINNNGNYEPGNCRWATKQEQNKNRRSNVFIELNGKSQCITDWANEYGLKPDTLMARLKKGWNLEKALNTPIRGCHAA